MVFVCCYFYYTLLCRYKIVLIWTMQQYHLNKLSPELGAEISEIDLSKDFNEEIQNKIYLFLFEKHAFLDQNFRYSLIFSNNN